MLQRTILLSSTFVCLGAFASLGGSTEQAIEGEALSSPSALQLGSSQQAGLGTLARSIADLPLRSYVKAQISAWQLSDEVSTFRPRRRARQLRAATEEARTRTIDGPIQVGKKTVALDSFQQDTLFSAFDELIERSKEVALDLTDPRTGEIRGSMDVDFDITQQVLADVKPLLENRLQLDPVQENLFGLLDASDVMSVAMRNGIDEANYNIARQTLASLRKAYDVQLHWDGVAPNPKLQKLVPEASFIAIPTRLRAPRDVVASTHAITHGEFDGVTHLWLRPLMAGDQATEKILRQAVGKHGQPLVDHIVAFRDQGAASPLVFDANGARSASAERHILATQSDLTKKIARMTLEKDFYAGVADGATGEIIKLVSVGFAAGQALDVLAHWLDNATIKNFKPLAAGGLDDAVGAGANYKELIEALNILKRMREMGIFAEDDIKHIELLEDPKATKAQTEQAVAALQERAGDYINFLNEKGALVPNEYARNRARRNFRRSMAVAALTSMALVVDPGDLTHIAGEGSIAGRMIAADSGWWERVLTATTYGIFSSGGTIGMTVFPPWGYVKPIREMVEAGKIPWPTKNGKRLQGASLKRWVWKEAHRTHLLYTAQQGGAIGVPISGAFMFGVAALTPELGGGIMQNIVLGAGGAMETGATVVHLLTREKARTKSIRRASRKAVSMAQ